MNFYKTSFLSGLYSVVNFLTALVLTKITATLIGPVGTAYIGKFANITNLVMIIATASIATGIIKYAAQYKNDSYQLRKLMNTSFGIILWGSIIGTLFIFFSYQFLNTQAFGENNFESVFLLFGIFLLAISSQVWFTGILNGLGEIRYLSIINISAAVLNLAFTSYFIFEYRIAGALFSNSLYGIFVTLSGLFAFSKLNLLKWAYFKPSIDRILAKQLIKYGLFAAITSSSWMCTMLVIREFIEYNQSTNEAGLWQAMFSLSERYLTLVTNILMVYYIPKLSSIEETNELVREMRKGFKRIIPLMLVLTGTIWLCKDLIITILLAESFRPMRELFTFQLLGDIFKIMAAILGYLVASKAMFRSGLKAELAFHALLIICSIFMIKSYGLVGASYAYAIASILYFLIYSFIFKDLLVLIKKSVIPKPWIK